MKNRYARLLVFFLFSLLPFLSALRALAVPASVSDSTVLVELYSSCGGKHWTNAPYWNTDKPLEDWAGVTLDAQGRVVSLFLSGKGLTGHLPASLGQLSALKYLGLGDNKLEGEAPASLTKLSELELLNLQNNLLTGFPSFQSHANPSQLSVFLSGNRLDFGDLEYNYKAAGQPIFKSLEAFGQKPRRDGYTLAVSLGEDISFPFLPFEGKHTTYQWQKSWQGIPENIPDTDGICGVNDVQNSELGTYRCVLHNTVVTGLTIVSESFELRDKAQVFLACDAGPDQIVCAGEALLQGGGVPVPKESHWEVVSLPEGGKVTFEDSTQAQTKVYLSKKGTYVFKWYLHGGLELPCWDYVSVTWASPQAEICEHALACEDEQASFDLTVTSGNNAGLYALRILDEQDGQVQLLTNLPYGQKKKIDFPYQSEHQYRLVLYEKDGAPLCLQNPYPLSFAEPAVTIQTDAAEKIVCASGSASFTVQASLSSSACKQPSWEAFSYYLFSKPDNALLASWPNTEGPIQTDPLPLGSYVLRASPKAWGYTACYGQTELLVLPSSLKAEVKIQNPSCHGSGDGSAEALVTGGEKYLEGTAYRCAWFRAEDAQKTDTLSALSSVSGLEAGNYVLEVRDAGACAEPPLQVYFSLSDAFPLEAPLLKASACGAEALLFPAGGEAPYTFAFEAKTENGYKLLAAVQGQEQNNGVTAQAGLPLPALVRVTVTDGRGCSVSSQDTYLEAPALTSSYNLCFRWRTAPKSAPAAVEPAFVSLPSLEADRMKQTLAEQQSTCLTNTEQALFALQESSCLALTSLEDETALSFERGEELHTLFYGDRAGRLLSSLPPEGVKPLAGNELSRANHPPHTRKSLYAYDESGAVLESTSPNGGTTRFRYNRLGQLRFSQDGVQQEKNTASFVVYDALSRPVRSGTAALNKDYFDPYQNKLYAIQSFEDLTALLEADEASFTALPAEARYPDAAQSTAEVTKTVYGTPQDVAYPVTGQGQTHLRGRVSMISRQNGQEEEAKHVKSYFAYDVHGNVAWTLTKRHDLSDQYTRSEYDLITGKVNKSVSNENSASALWQRFAYDEDGRLLASESSRDGVLFEPDARYAFYKHGPLKRIVLGADAVQGIDLTATLQGLIKGINHPTADPSADGENNTVGADAFASVLSYRTNDFVHQATPFTAKDPLTLLEQNHAKGGLVGGWVSKEGYGGSGTVYDQTHGRTFVYDKAGRLKQSNTKLYNEQTKVFANTEDYKESFAYDRNGNLTSLTRNAHGLEGKNRAQDKLSYYYTENTDRLRHIKDAVGAANWSGDLDDQGEDNYAYDQAGRLIKDKAEGIEQIDWTSDDKVARVLKADKTEIRFRYGTGGERIEKSVIPQGKQTEAKSTLYASGMVLERKREVVNDKTYDEVLILKEQSLAEGLLTRERELQRIRYEEGKAPKPIVTLSIPEAYASAERGAKTYALKDHLGSVRVSVSDTKLSDMQDDKPSNFKAEVLSIARYDAFGSPQQGRQYASKNYRYGYNGMEKDEELKGSGNSYDYGARFYDPRAGRFLSLDPLRAAFPGRSPYLYAANDPVSFIDQGGMSETFATLQRQSDLDPAPKRDVFTGQKETADQAYQRAATKAEGNLAAGKAQLIGILSSLIVIQTPAAVAAGGQLARAGAAEVASFSKALITAGLKGAVGAHPWAIPVAAGAAEAVLAGDAYTPGVGLDDVDDAVRGAKKGAGMFTQALGDAGGGGGGRYYHRLVGKYVDVGEYLGEGISKRVFVHPTDPGRVRKLYGENWTLDNETAFDNARKRHPSMGIEEEQGKYNELQEIVQEKRKTNPLIRVAESTWDREKYTMDQERAFGITLNEFRNKFGEAVIPQSLLNDLLEIIEKGFDINYSNVVVRYSGEGKDGEFFIPTITDVTIIDW